MLLQPGPLEEQAVDKAGGRFETGLFVTPSVDMGEKRCSEKRARLLLQRGRAVVHRRYPFTIRLEDRAGGATQPIRLKLDPGASVTGVSLVREANDGQHVVHLAEISHRGNTVHKHMTRRAAFRRRRRSANLRYRTKRFDNRRRPDGWLPPSLRSRLDNSISWVSRYRRIAPISSLSVENVRFDMQALERPGIQGIEYQQGELAGYELREALLERWGRKCVYCNAQGVPLQIEHIRPKARGGSNRLSNLTLACACCNQAKGAHPVEAFLADRPDVLRRVLAHAKKPLHAAAAVNTTRKALVEKLQTTGMPIELSSGGRTKANRFRLSIPKTHALDASCVGTVDAVFDWDIPVLSIQATGRGSHQRTRLTAHGFPRGFLMRAKSIHGFQTGDMVRAVVPSGKKAGVHIGRVAIRASGSFNIQTDTGVVQGISHRHCRIIHRADGYAYAITSPATRTEGAAPPGPEEPGLRREKN